MVNGDKIGVKTSKGLEILALEEIICCVAKGRYTKVIITSGKEYLLSRVLKDVENIIHSEHFIRTHKSFLINLDHILQYDGHSSIKLRNNVYAELSVKRKHTFLNKLDEFVQKI